MMNKIIESGWTDFNIDNTIYDNLDIYVGSQNSDPAGIFFKSDGTKLYVIGLSGTRVYQYSLSTAWVINTASYDNVSFSINQATAPNGLFFKPDGTKMYVIDYGNDYVYQYSLSTAWDVSTASYDNKSFSVNSQETTPMGLFFKDDGTKMYIVGYTNDTVYQYSLSTAWDVSTASYDNKSFSVNSQESDPRDLFFNPDGTKMWIIGQRTDTIYQYVLSTAWDVSTASYDNKSFSVNSQEPSPNGIFFKPDGKKMYICGSFSDDVKQYSLS